jgi:predicted DNA-binding protein (UPF0251 family)
MVNERVTRTRCNAVSLLGLSYREAACSLQTREPTITRCLNRGRRHVASALISDAHALPNPCGRQRRAPTAAPPVFASRLSS